VPPSEFVMSIPHSAAKDEFYDPAKHAVLFPAGRPQSDAALCTERSRLAYCGLETSFGFDQDRIRKVLARVGFTNCQFFENSSTPMVRVLVAFLRSKRTTIAAPKAGFRRISPAPIRTILLTGLGISTLGPSRGNSSRAKSTRVLLQVDEEI